MLSLNEELSSHLHNKIVHFPMAIGVLAFFFSLLHLRRKSYETTVFILVILGLIFSRVAFIAGINQVEPFVGTGKYWLVDLHRYFGISILLTYFIWLFFMQVEKNKKICMENRVGCFYSNSYHRFPRGCDSSLV